MRKSRIFGNQSSLSRQSGVVLIMALLIVALVTTVVVSVSWRFNLSVIRNMNRWHGSQARVLLEAAEQAALQGLRLDAQLSNVDSLLEQWAAPVNYPTDFGMLSGQLEDAHGRLNLNLMVADPQPQPPEQPKSRLELYSYTQRMFIRFLQTIELEDGLIDQTRAMELVDAIEDWIDADNFPVGPGGAESSYYEGLEPPVVITDGEMSTVSELSLVKGMTPELFKRLEPYVIALPGYKDPSTAVRPNINTLKPELLRCLNNLDVLTPLDEASFAVVKTVRDAAYVDPSKPGFQSAEEFFNNPELSTMWLEPRPYKNDDFLVSSSYFLLFAQVSIEDQSAGAGTDAAVVRKGKSLLLRPAGNAMLSRVVRRTDANF